jgi:MFS family permease
MGKVHRCIHSRSLAESLPRINMALKRETMKFMPVTLLFAGTVFASAFSLFLVQPIIAKQILPWFGGSASVWATCMVFFQLVLLAGYGYADWISRRLQPRAQVVLHVALLIASLYFLPIVANPSWKPQGDEDPFFRILALLTGTVGLPYFMLSTTGPLVQSWVARTMVSASVYRYFSLSNLASMAALLSYPFFIEPHTAIVLQAYGWSAIYALFTLLCAGAGGYFARHVQEPTDLLATEGVVASGHRAPVPQPTASSYLLWLLASALGSWMLLAVTSHITQNVAAIPFLWLLPLTLYLLTFVLCFEGDRWYRPVWFRPLAAVLTVVCAYGLINGQLGSHITVAIPLYITTLFVLCMFFHGELAALRPEARYLTRFYLMISVGGAAGGIAVGLIAPRVLPAYYELGIGLVLASALALWLVRPRMQRLVAGGVGLLSACFLFLQVAGDLEDRRYLDRNFYGTLLTLDSVYDPPQHNRRLLFHGNIKHGEQFLDPALSREPTAYYGQTSGVGLAIANTPASGKKVGVIGLGAGTLATYGQKGDTYRMYELDPAVIEIARTEFSFVSQSDATIDMVLGDARLSLEREAPQAFDVLAVDAFSGDAVPVHLITRQAMEIYLRHLKPEGVVAFHLTNQYLNLPPVVAKIADAMGLQFALVHDEPTRPAQRDTDWVLVTRSKTLLNLPAIHHASVAPTPIPGLGVWTDDYNNLFQVLR